MKKMVTIALVLVLSLAFSTTAFARGCCRRNPRTPAAWSVGDVDVDGLAAQRQVFLDALLVAGQITQAQADDDLAWYREMLEGELSENPTAFRGFRGGGGFGGCRGFGGIGGPAPWCPWFGGDVGETWGSEHYGFGCWGQRR